MKSYTITIGIPAYNEEANIHYLLSSVLNQKEDGFSIQDIIVVSDGSTDNTVLQARTVKDSRIRVRAKKTRAGTNQTLNEITRMATGDILILLNADIIIPDPQFIKTLIAPFRENAAVGLVGAAVVSLPPEGLFESIMSTSADLRNDIYNHLRHGRNVYTCHGRARAFAKPLYQSIVWPDDCPEDAFSYFFCIQHGFSFMYTPRAAVLFRSAGTLPDHKKQSHRFAFGKRQLEKYFPLNMIAPEFHIPLSNIAASVIKFLMVRPLQTIAYIAITVYIRVLSHPGDIEQSKWEIAVTSKQVIHS